VDTLKRYRQMEKELLRYGKKTTDKKAIEFKKGMGTIPRKKKKPMQLKKNPAIPAESKKGRVSCKRGTR